MESPKFWMRENYPSPRACDYFAINSSIAHQVVDYFLLQDQRKLKHTSWGCEANVYHCVFENTPYVIKYAKGNHNPQEYCAHQLRGQQLLEQSGVTAYAPIQIVELDKHYLVQLHIEGLPGTRRVSVETVLNPHGLTMSEPTANAIIHPQCGLTIYDFSHITKLA